MTDSTAALDPPIVVAHDELNPAHAKSTPPSGVQNWGLQAVLPGHGRSGEDCGEYVARWCARCDESFWVPRSCRQRECPRCYVKWALTEGRTGAWRFWYGCDVVGGLDAYGYPKGRRLHSFVSFKGTGDYLADRDRARVITKKHGIEGGLMIPHPFRIDAEALTFVPQDMVHFHTVGFASGEVVSGGLKSDREAVFRVVPDPVSVNGKSEPPEPTYRGFQTEEEVKRCVFYLLTHCGVQEGRHSLTWFGSLSYNMLPCKRLDHFGEMPVPVVPCPKCGGPTELCERREYGIGNSGWDVVLYHQMPKYPCPDRPPPVRWQRVNVNGVLRGVVIRCDNEV